MMWLLPIVNKRFGFGAVPQYGLKLLWLAQSWNAFDVFVISNLGCTQANIKNATKYLLDSAFVGICGDDGIVTKIVGQDCSWADASFTYGFGLMWIVAIVQWISVLYTHKTFSFDDGHMDMNMNNAVVSIQASYGD